MSPEQPPTIRVAAGDGVTLPALQDQRRPRIVIWASGSIDHERLPLFERLESCTEEEILEFFEPPESMGWNDAMLNGYAWAQESAKWLVALLPTERYGGLPYWFPTTDLAGRQLTEVAQVDRFLHLLSHVITLPQDHRATDPGTLAVGLVELRKAYEDGAFEEWDEESWPTSAQSDAT